MPNDSSKAPPAILELPAGLTLDQLQTLVNERIRDLNTALQGYVLSPALKDVDLGLFRGINCADPKDDLDVVNLRTLKRGQGQQTETTAVAGKQQAAAEAPTICFAKDGFVLSDESSPPYVVNENRAGFVPVKVSLAADSVATTGPLIVNVTLEGVAMLSANLQLPAGSTGPVYATGFALPGPVALGNRIRPRIISSGGAGMVSVELVLEKA